MDSNKPSPADAEELSRWLRIRGFGQYVSRFADRSISFKDLAHLTEDDLKRLGVGTIVHRVALLSEIALLKGGDSGVSQATTAGAIAAFPKSAAPFPGMSKPSVIPPSGRIIASAGPAPVAPGVTTARAALLPRRKTLKERFGGRFLIISILAHILFGVGATYYVVQTIAAKRKLTFHGGPPSPNPSQRAIEHKVQMAKKQNTMSAPVPSKRVVTTGLSKISLPAMPAMPDMNAASSKMMGMGGVGVGMAPSIGAMGSGNNAGGGAIPFFGLRTKNDLALVGTFYDLKQTNDRRPTGMTPQLYAKEITSFLNSNWDESHFSKFYKAPNQLYNTQIFMPDMDADKGPSSFGVEKEVQPRLWVVYYKGMVTPAESGNYHFVGHGDDILLVRFGGRLVLAACWDNPYFGIVQTKWKPEGTYAYGWPLPKTPFPFRRGNTMEVRAGVSYPIEVLIGEQPGGRGHAVLLVEKEGVEYKKDARGNPILPIFRLADTKMPPLEKDESFPPYVADGPLWKGLPNKLISLPGMH